MKKSQIFLIGGLVCILAGIFILVFLGTEPDSKTPLSEGTTSIEGSLGYPSEGIPDDLKVCALEKETEEEHCTLEKKEDEKYVYGVGYELSLPSGEYFVKASRPDAEAFKGVYTEYVECGMEEGCRSHKPILVQVSDGESQEGVDVLDWQQFPEKLEVSSAKEEIELETPEPFQVVKSPISVSGQARGSWFFEADFPLRVENKEGELVTSTFVTTTEEWMTEEFVSFKKDIDYEHPSAGYSYLILEKANPSGLPENSDELRIPVYLR